MAALHRSENATVVSLISTRGKELLLYICARCVTLSRCVTQRDNNVSKSVLLFSSLWSA